MRLLITGGSGLLGSDLVPAALSVGHDVLAPSSADFDITDPASAAALGSGSLGKFDWCVNLAGYTNVDVAETHVREATELNVLGPGYLAQACNLSGCRLLHISTDYVFGGNPGDAFGEDDPPAPIQKYGESKLEGERAVLERDPSAVVARISWLYGIGKRCFPASLLEAFLVSKPLKIVSDQIGVPSYTAEVSRMLLELMAANPEPGIFHVAGADAVSRFEYAEAVGRAFTRSGQPGSVDLTPVPSSEFPTPAPRPANSVITTEKVIRYVAPHISIDAAMDLFVANWVKRR